MPTSSLMTCSSTPRARESHLDGKFLKQTHKQEKLGELCSACAMAPVAVGNAPSSPQWISYTRPRASKGTRVAWPGQRTGQFPRKEQTIQAWCEVFNMKATGHSARRSGALHYIREGWDIPQVGYLGRWKSSMILEYAREALESMPVNKAWVPRSSSATPSSLEINALMEDNHRAMRLQVEGLKKDLKKSTAEIEEKMAELGRQCSDEGGCLPKLVQSLGGKVTHVNVALIASSPPVTWRTRCGWFYGRSNFCFINSGSEITCLKCKAAQSSEVEYGSFE